MCCVVHAHGHPVAEQKTAVGRLGREDPTGSAEATDRIWSLVTHILGAVVQARFVERGAPANRPRAAAMSSTLLMKAISVWPYRISSRVAVQPPLNSSGTIEGISGSLHVPSTSTAGRP